MNTSTEKFNWKAFIVTAVAWSLIILAVVAMILFVVISIVYFPPRGMSSSLANLGLYGDYFGGFISSIVSLASLGVTIFLALAIQRIERENSKSAIESQRKVALMQIRFQEITRFSSKCDLCIEDIAQMYKNSEVGRNGSIEMELQIERLIILFPEISDKLIEEIAILRNALKSSITLSHSFKSRTDEYGGRILINPHINDVAKVLHTVSMSYYKLIERLSAWASE